MRPIYNDELYHFGKLGMKWGHHKIQEMQKANNIYKKKIDKIANSKSAHKADVDAVTKVNMPIYKRVGRELVGAMLSTLVSDVITGKAKNYGSMSMKDVTDRFSSIGKRVISNITIDEITARSVANKYDTTGKRVKGSNKEMFTREQLVKSGVRAVNTAIMLAPLAKIGLGLGLKYRNEKKRAAEETVNRWGGRILSDKVTDYSHIIPNVSYSVK